MIKSFIQNLKKLNLIACWQMDITSLDVLCILFVIIPRGHDAAH